MAGVCTQRGSKPHKRTGSPVGTSGSSSRGTSLMYVCVCEKCRASALSLKGRYSLRPPQPGHGMAYDTTTSAERQGMVNSMTCNAPPIQVSQEGLVRGVVQRTVCFVSHVVLVVIRRRGQGEGIGLAGRCAARRPLHHHRHFQRYNTPLAVVRLDRQTE